MSSVKHQEVIVYFPHTYWRQDCDCHSNEPHCLFSLAKCEHKTTHTVFFYGPAGASLTFHTFCLHNNHSILRGVDWGFEKNTRLVIKNIPHGVWVA